jgi:anti-sigma B factor antagonist
MSEFTAALTNDPRGVILRLSGKLEYETVRDFERTAEELVLAKPPFAVLDAAELRYINSAGIGAVIKLHRRLQEWGGELRVAALMPELLQMLKLCYFDRVLKIFDTVDRAFEDSGARAK